MVFSSSIFLQSAYLKRALWVLTHKVLTWSRLLKCPLLKCTLEGGSSSKVLKWSLEVTSRERCEYPPGHFLCLSVCSNLQKQLSNKCIFWTDPVISVYLSAFLSIHSHPPAQPYGPQAQKVDPTAPQSGPQAPQASPQAPLTAPQTPLAGPQASMADP